MAVTIPDDQWHMIDEAIFANLKLKAIQQIRSFGGCSLREAIDCLYERYAQLRKDAPDRFASSERDYWAGFES